VVDLAAAYAFGIVRNHPFVDGNERVAFLAAALFLLEHDFEVTAVVEDFKSFADAMANKLAKEIDVADRSAVGRISSRPSK
jgi:death on curing protein